jgi:hypothetical protein
MPDLATPLRDWIHETPMSRCGVGSDACPDWELAYALAEAIVERNSPLGPLAHDELLRVTREVLHDA